MPRPSGIQPIQRNAEEQIAYENELARKDELSEQQNW
jgi:hypothetical protein